MPQIIFKDQRRSSRCFATVKVCGTHVVICFLTFSLVYIFGAFFKSWLFSWNSSINEFILSIIHILSYSKPLRSFIFIFMLAIAEQTLDWIGWHYLTKLMHAKISKYIFLLITRATPGTIQLVFLNLFFMKRKYT